MNKSLFTMGFITEEGGCNVCVRECPSALAVVVNAYVFECVLWAGRSRLPAEIKLESITAHMSSVPLRYLVSIQVFYMVSESCRVQ